MELTDKVKLKKWWSLREKELGEEYKKMHNGQSTRVKVILEIGGSRVYEGQAPTMDIGERLSLQCELVQAIKTILERRNRCYTHPMR